MTATTALAHAEAEGLTLTAEGGTLRVRGLRRPSPELLAELQRHKQDLLLLLDLRAAVRRMSPGPDEAAQERCGASPLPLPEQTPEADYLAWQGQCAREMARILHPDGHLFLNVGSDTKHPWNAIEVAKTYGRHLTLQQTIIWVKSVALDASSIPERALRRDLHERTFGHFVSLNSECQLNPTWEPVFHFTPTGRSPINRLAIGVPYVFKDQPARFGHHRTVHCRGNVWHVPYETTQSRADRDHHPATFPVRLAELCLLLADLKPDELALDPFAGIGSTLLAAQRLRARAIGFATASQPGGGWKKRRTWLGPQCGPLLRRPQQRLKASRLSLIVDVR